MCIRDRVHSLGDFALRQGVVPLQQVEDGAVEAVEHGGGGHGEQKLHERAVN